MTCCIEFEIAEIDSPKPVQLSVNTNKTAYNDIKFPANGIPNTNLQIKNTKVA